MKLLKPLPPNRTFEQIQNHYLVEKAIAERLKNANREERKHIYATMYDELFKQVPDHSRITRRNDDRQTQLANRSKLALVNHYLNSSTVLAEFAPGDCMFALQVAKQVKAVYAIDISDQRGENKTLPDNFTLVIYDGYQLDEVKENSVDVVFSDQLVEHLHPEDTRLHFELAFKILKPGGVYVFRTPHAFPGPSDVSQFFSYVPQGFHLKEWTYVELRQLLKDIRFSHLSVIWNTRRNIQKKLPYPLIELFEHFLRLLPVQFRRNLTRRIGFTICVVATK